MNVEWRDVTADGLPERQGGHEGSEPVLFWRKGKMFSGWHHYDELEGRVYWTCWCGDRYDGVRFWAPMPPMPPGAPA